MLRKILQAGFGGLILFPFLVVLLLSASGSWVFPALLPGEWTLSRWEGLVGSSSELSWSLGVSLLISLSVATLATGLSFLSSRFIAYHRHRRRFLLLAYFPYVFAPVILAACIQFYFIRLGLSGKLPGVLLAQLLITYPFGLILFQGFWNDRMRNMEALTATLGGNFRQTLLKVLVPAAKGPLLVCFFQTFLISWFEYGLTTLIGVGKVQTLTIKVFQYINEADTFYAAMASSLLILPPVVLLWLNKRYVFRSNPGNVDGG